MRSFRPVIDQRARILILGSMPGPESLRLRQYYGFSGNHFWRILFDLLEVKPPASYSEKIALLKESRIALWDVAGTCLRVGASDSSIRQAVPNKIPALLGRYKALHTIFINGKTAEALYRKYFSDQIQIAAYYLPSTSPANASMPYAQKLEKWRMILPYLQNRNMWC